MKQQVNTRFDSSTLNQINWLASRWGVSQTQTITKAINQAYRQELRKMVVNLYEDNAGGLFIGSDYGPWWNVTGAQDNSFDDDAIAIVSGDTDDWTVEQIDAEPDAPIVGIWEDGALHVLMTTARQPVAKIAARRYMGLQS